MKLINKEKPWSYLSLIIIQILISVVVIGLAIAIDVYTISTAPPLETPGFRFPVWTMLAMCFMGCITVIVIVVALIMVFIRKSQLSHRKKQEEQKYNKNY